MREYKFRAWHEIASGSPAFGPGMIHDNNPGDCLKWHNDGQQITDIMQFTGLFDKDGSEIYEGDFIITGAVDSIPYLVEWITTCGQSRFTKRRIGGEQHYDIGNDVSDYVSVIGNIHQNPEMLK